MFPGSKIELLESSPGQAWPRSWRADLAALLAHLDVFLVGVHCAPDELDRVERARGDRSIGEGRAHVELDGIHTFGPYDFEIDTTAGVNTQTIASVLSAWQHRAPSGGALAQSTQNR